MPPSEGNLSSAQLIRPKFLKNQADFIVIKAPATTIKRHNLVIKIKNGARRGIRTPDPRLIRPVL